MNPDVTHRLLVPIQARGNVGKSTILNALAGWLEQRSVAWRGFDLDPDHRSFERCFPATVAWQPLGEEPEGDLIKLLRTCTANPVTVIDPRAHLNEIVLRSWEMIRFPESFATTGGRITVLLFPADDLEVMTDLDRTVSRLAGTVDYVVVKNRARAPRTRMFDGSELEADLFRLGAVTLDVTVLLSMARNHLAALEAELGRGVSHLESVANRELSLDPMMRLIIEDWVKVLFRRFDRIAATLLPANLAAAITPEEANAAAVACIRRGAKINRSNC
ncbi:MAG: ATPase [Pirellulales bacterium]|nr:ATPase [Pirellulales bacterium]